MTGKDMGKDAKPSQRPEEGAGEPGLGMNRLHFEALFEIRDQLRERGARASTHPHEGEQATEEADYPLFASVYGPLCDAMFAAMTADGHLASSEREVLIGALRQLDDQIRSSHIERMLARSAERHESLGGAAFLREIARALAEDPVRTRLAFVLAATVAMADNQLADEEQSLLGQLAVALGIDESEATSLLEAVG